MKISYKEQNDKSVYDIDLNNELLLTSGPVLSIDTDSSVCDCTEFGISGNTLDVNKITIWNLMFNKEVKDFLNRLKK